MSDQPLNPEVAHLSGELHDVYNDVVPIVKETKDGYKTTEFWVVLATAALVNIQPAVPDKWQAIITGAIAIGYALARGHAKSGVPEVDGSVVA